MRSSQHFLFFGTPAPDGRFVLDADESRHALSVLRVKPGGMLHATDGSGTVFECRVETEGGEGVSCAVVSRSETTTSEPRVHCFVGIPEKDAFECVLDVLGPLDIAELTPVICEYGQDAWWKSSWEKQSLRFRRKIVAGLKQSLNPRLPLLHAPVGFGAALSSSAGTIVFAERDGDASWSDVVAGLASRGSRVDCWIGPPGGFSGKEVASLRGRGGRPVTLGPFRIRTETALTVLCGAIRASAAARKSAQGPVS